ncbi:MAG: HD domain-containing phosphohydrolase [Bdellovibrionota bacterium]
MASNPFLAILAPFPPTLVLLQERIRDLGYLDFEVFTPEHAAEVEFPLDPLVAVVPLSSRSDLISIGRAVAAYRARFPETHLLAFVSERVKFRSAEVLDLGIDAFYRLPFEEEVLINKLFEIAPVEASIRDLTFEKLMRVNVMEIENAKTLPFNVYLYLPMNRRAIMYVERGREIDDKLLRKFRENAHYNLYIQRSSLKDYLSYSASILAQGDPAAGARDRARRTGQQLAGLMGGYFTDDSMTEDETRMMLENLKSVVSKLGDVDQSKSDMGRAVSQFVSAQMTHFSHAQNVAAYCCLFGLALGVSNAESLRIGGLLHDLGLSDLPVSLVGRWIDEMTPEEQQKYREHPETGLKSVEERKALIPADALDMILYHHERPDGSGYPHGLSSKDIPPVAKVCAFADEFDKFTSVRPGMKQLSPPEAIRRIAGLDGGSPSPVYESTFHGPLVKLFLDRPAPPVETKGVASAGSGVTGGKVRVIEEKIAQGSSRTVKLSELYSNPRFRAHDDRTAVILDHGSQIMLQDLRGQLRAHWAAKGQR